MKPAAIVMDIQSLGRVEAILSAWERQNTPTCHNQQTRDYDFNTDPNSMLLMQIIAVSRMWALSGYEILRTMNNQTRQNKVATDLENEFYYLFWRFTMVRMEAAKYEHAGVKGTIGNPTKIMQIDNDGIVRVGWRVYCKKTRNVLDITRRNLADEFVTTLSYIRKNLPEME